VIHSLEKLVPRRDLDLDLNDDLCAKGTGKNCLADFALSPLLIAFAEKYVKEALDE
jgi:hypothetical protein